MVSKPIREGKQTQRAQTQREALTYYYGIAAIVSYHPQEHRTEATGVRLHIPLASPRAILSQPNTYIDKYAGQTSLECAPAKS